jgi:hypothetical protein
MIEIIFPKNAIPKTEAIIVVPDSKSRNIPEVVVVRRRAGGVLGIWEGWVNWWRVG